jgi:hypothetical protein
MQILKVPNKRNILSLPRPLFDLVLAEAYPGNAVESYLSSETKEKILSLKRELLKRINFECIRAELTTMPRAKYKRKSHRG